MPRNVVFILSTAHSGSHLLAQLLGAHSRCLSIGELCHARAQGLLAARNLLNDYATNPVFQGITDAPEGQWHARIFANAVARWPAVTTLIDNSKQIDWARRSARSRDISPHFIHLLRDPRALLRHRHVRETSLSARFRGRLQLLRRRRRHWLDAWARPIDAVWILDWIASNEEIQRALRGCQASIVLYEELANDPSGSLARLLPDLGLSFEESQLAYGRAAQAGTLRREYIGAAARSIIRPDLRWRTELPAATIRRARDSRALAGYLATLGLTVTDSGLQRAASARR